MQTRSMTQQQQEEEFEDAYLQNLQNPHVPTFKIALIGDGGVGKTTFVEHHLTQTFDPKYIPTLGVEVHPVYFKTNKGYICFNVWDCAGQEQYSGLRDGYYIQANGAIVMFDVTSNLSFKNAFNWEQSFQRVAPTSSVVYVANKADIPDSKVSDSIIRSKIGFVNMVDGPFRGLGCVKVSSKTGYHLDEPFLVLARNLMNDQSLQFVQ